MCILAYHCHAIHYFVVLYMYILQTSKLTLCNVIFILFCIFQLIPSSQEGPLHLLTKNAVFMDNALYILACVYDTVRGMDTVSIMTSVLGCNNIM